MIAHYHIASPPRTGNAAIAIIELRGEIDRVLTGLGVATIQPLRVALRTIPDVDTLVIARPELELAWFFPHAGPVILRRLTAALERSGAAVAPASPAGPVRPVPPIPPADLWEPLAAALARAASPLAIDLLLDQPRRWAAPDAQPLPPEHARILNRLIDPPLVVALGPPNIGKSSLLNALAGRTVAIVADEPGTTRDHVGALIDFGGLVVRYIDAPGITSPSLREGAGGWAGLQVGAPSSPSPVQYADPIQSEAQRLALQTAAAADLILSCGDASSGFLPTLPTLAAAPCLRVALRADLGLPEPSHDLAVSVRDHYGLDQLVASIHKVLVPATALADPSPWPFWAHA